MITLYGQMTSYRDEYLVPLHKYRKKPLMVLPMRYLSEFAREIGQQFYAKYWTEDGDLIFYANFYHEKEVDRFFAKLIRIYGSNFIQDFRQGIDIGRWEIQ